MYQEITIIGNVGRDANFRYTPQGIAVCDFSVAVSRKWGKGEDKREETTWFNVTAWRDQAETVQKYVKKGMLIMVRGTVKATAWIDKQGQPQPKLEITADTIKFLSRSDNGSGSAPDSQPEPAAANGSAPDTDIPF